MDPLAVGPIAAQGATATPAALTAGGVSGAPVKDAAEGFEAIFLRQMLRDLRKTATFDSEKSSMSGFYTDMFDDFLAEHMAKTGGIGLASVIRTYLERSPR